MKSLAVTCDACNKDLTTSPNCVASRLVLTCEAIPCTEYTIAFGPPVLVLDVHFCNFSCLALWANKQVNKP